MADVFDVKRMMLLKSVNTPDFLNNVNYIVNPNMSAVASVAPKYWKVSGTAVIEMDAAEKAAVDAAIPPYVDPIDALAKRIGDLETALAALAERVTKLEKP